jgi:hypothetical protein
MRKTYGPVELTVKSAALSDVFGDMARVNKDYRPFAKAGRVIRIRCEGKMVRAVARGEPAGGKDRIILDSSTRQKLGVKLNTPTNFTFEMADSWDEFVWAWQATDAMPRIAARLGLISVILGLIGLGLGIVSLIK